MNTENLEAYIKTITNNTPLDERVISAFHEQFLGIELSEKQKINLELLKSSGVAKIVTGQQIGILGGPVFTIYKILSCIKLAHEISSNFNISAIPIFWLQTEDHDYEEISEIKIISSYPPRLTKFKLKSNNSRVSVEYRILEDQIQSFHDELKTIFPQATDILEALSSSYAPGKSLSRAFFEFYNYLFAKYGLLFFNPRNQHTSSIISEIFEKALYSAEELSLLLEKRTNEINSLGINKTIHISNKSPLFFFHPQGKNTERYRIEITDNNKLSLKHTLQEFTFEEILKQVKESPLNFSSSALIRPIIQDKLLNTTFYIAGDSEIEYLSQTTPLYDWFKINQPKIVSRNHFLVIDDKCKKLIKELNLSEDDLLLGIKFIDNKLRANALRGLSSNNNPEVLKNYATSQIQQVIDKYSKAITEVDKTLLSPLKKTEERIYQSLNILNEKYIDAINRADTTRQQRIEKLKTFIFPNDNDQERELAAIYFLCIQGENFISKVLDNTSILQKLKNNIIIVSF